VLEESRECDGFEDTVEIECSDGVYSPSEWGGVSTMCSGIELGTDLCRVSLPEVVKGRMIDHGGDFSMSRASSGSESRASQALICFATQGFCVQRSFEK